ncbi:MAG TPA: hypothetical protein DDW70_06480 [Rikenellaceae bacterium]|jgi:uncharacterized membrane protein HdeD (DUF308 family)|nr:DUF308 domain-containing protein [Bacteroidales bacterium]HBG53837.1 hypothetical protein [Rikenellaceae bacterium]
MKALSYIRYSALRGFLGIVLGVFLLAYPEAGVRTLVRLLAAILLVGGLFALYFAFRNNRQTNAQPISNRVNPDQGLQRLLYMTSLVFIVFALLLILFPGFFAGLTMFLIGIVLLLSSLTQITGIIQFRKANSIGLPWFIYINPVIIFILSVVIMLNPFDSASTLIIFAGVICLIYALTEIIQAIVQYRLIKKSNTPVS